MLSWVCKYVVGLLSIYVLYTGGIIFVYSFYNNSLSILMNIGISSELIIQIINDFLSYT